MHGRWLSCKENSFRVVAVRPRDLHNSHTKSKQVPDNPESRQTRNPVKPERVMDPVRGFSGFGGFGKRGIGASTCHERLHTSKG